MTTLQQRMPLVLVAIISLTVFMVFFTNPVFGGGRDNSPFVQQEKFYYLTRHPYQGDFLAEPEATPPCEEGYHFAHVWELLDFSNLTYNIDLGFTTAESGLVPPNEIGWVRAGFGGPLCDLEPGDAWNWAEGREGPVGRLDAWMLFNQPPDARINSWTFHTHYCGHEARLWCVSD